MTGVSSAESAPSAGRSPDPQAETRSVGPAATHIDTTGRDNARSGSRIRHYTVVASIGRGGMGEVYEAHDPRLDRNVALKLHRTRRGHSKERARLIRAAQAAGLAHPPNVIEVYDVGSVDGDVFIAIELVRGQNVRQWTRAHQRTHEQILDVFLAAGRGLQAAHERGLVHRDFSPVFSLGWRPPCSSRINRDSPSPSPSRGSSSKPSRPCRRPHAGSSSWPRSKPPGSSATNEPTHGRPELASSSKARSTPRASPLSTPP